MSPRVRKREKKTFRITKCREFLRLKRKRKKRAKRYLGFKYTGRIKKPVNLQNENEYGTNSGQQLLKKKKNQRKVWTRCKTREPTRLFQNPKRGSKKNHKNKKEKKS